MGKSNEKKIKDALKKVGSKLNVAEIERIKKETGVKGSIAPIAKQLGIELSYGVRSRGKSPSVEVPGFEGYSFGEELTPPVFDYQSALNFINAQGNIDTRIAGINAEASKYIARLETGSARDVANIQLTGTKYVADRELEGVLGAENIRARGAVDLQRIVNAGMRDVETVRGEYGVKGKKIDRSTAVMAGLVNAFSF